MNNLKVTIGSKRKTNYPANPRLVGIGREAERDNESELKLAGRTIPHAKRVGIMNDTLFKKVSRLIMSNMDVS